MSLKNIRAVLISGLFISCAAFAQVTGSQLVHQCTSKKVISFDDLVRNQVNRSFQNKFSVITKDIHKTSKKNLNDLILALREKRDLDNYLNRAEEFIGRFESQMVLIHGTKAEHASSILNSGFILSTDELYRRNISLDKLGLGALYDGSIGEQDTVYLTYQAKTADYLFGPVFFKFDIPPVMRQAYITFNSFYGDNSNLNCDPKTFKVMTRAYRSIVFEGGEYKKLIVLSLAQMFWLEDHPEGLGDNLSLFDNFKTTTPKDVINAFVLFPSYDKSNQDLMLRHAHGFWEVKVPEKLSLDFLKSIVVPASDNELIQEVYGFAKQKQWNTNAIPLSGERLEIIFLK